MMRYLQWLMLLALLAFPTPAPAQISGGSGFKVVTTCGTLVPAYAAGSVQTPTMDVNGQACSGVTVGPPVGGATSANQTNGQQKTQIVDGSGNVIGATSNNLNVQCANCSGSGASAVDEASFTAGSSVFAPTGGFFQTTATSNPLTNGQQGMQQFTAQRAGFVNLRNASGTEIGTSTTPLQVSLANTAANATALLVTGAGGSFPITGTVTATQGSPPWTVTGTGTAGSAASGVLTIQGIASMTKLLVTPDANSAVNVAQINGVIPLMGNGVTGTGSQRVTIASDNTAFSVNATLSAETTKVIGTVNQGTSPWVVSGTVTAANASVSATGSAVPASATFAGLSDGTNLRGWLNAANALNSTGAGIGTSQIIGQFDDVAPTAITENQFGNVRMSANRNVYQTIRDAAGNERGANVNASNQLSVSIDGSTATNISTNLAQVNGVTVLTGTGAVGTGAQRVAVGTDTATIAGSAPGTAGTASAQVVSVQGVASMTPVQVSQATASNLNAQVAGNVASGASDSGNPVKVAGVYNSTKPTLTNGQRGDLQLTTRGALTMTLVASDNTTTPNIIAINSDAQSTTNIAIAAASFGQIYDATANNWGRQRNVVTGTDTAGTGITAVGLLAQLDDTSPSTVTENQFGNLRMSPERAVLSTPTPSATTGGTTLFTLTLAASTNATNVKSTPGQVYSISGFNISSATPVWISLYNNSGTPTCGTSIVQQFMIPGNTTGAGFVYDFAMPKGFSSGIAFCATTGIAGTGSPAATTYVLNIDYK